MQRSSGGAAAEMLEPRVLLASVELVRDINADGEHLGNRPAQLTVVGSTLYFIGNDYYHGPELWKSDGTAAGTMLVKDLIPGPAIDTSHTSPRALTAFNGTLYFIARDSVVGKWQVWKTDGTETGTVPVTNLAEGVSDNGPLVVMGGHLYFRAYGGPDAGLWRTSGAPGGATMVAPVFPELLTAVGDRLFFSASTTAAGFELWTSDGSAAGTKMVKDIFPGQMESAPSMLTAVGNTLFFAANDGVTGRELWKSDGTEAGTLLVKDIRAGDPSSSPANLTNVNGTLYFAGTDGPAGTELWKSDGTTDGTQMVKDIRPGQSGSAPARLTLAGGTLFFTASDGTRGTELWKTDGTANGTVLVKDIYALSSSSDPQFLTAFNGLLYFAAAQDSSLNVELYKSDGTSQGTSRLLDLFPGLTGSVANLMAMNGKLFFSADDGNTGNELWSTDGTAGGTALVKNINPLTRSSDPNRLQRSGNKAYFLANDNQVGEKLWVTDGTEAGTFILRASNGGVWFFGDSIDVDGTFYFEGMIGDVRGLWRTDGTDLGTTYVGNFDMRAYGTAGGMLFFTTLDGSLYRTNGAPGTTVNLGTFTNVEGMTEFNGSLYFLGANASGGPDLWKSNGTAAGTTRAVDLPPGQWDGFTWTTVAGNLLFFEYATSGAGGELWRTDGTPAGTVMLKDIYPGSTSSIPSSLAALGNTLYFSARDPLHGDELWKSDGTPQGTVLVKDLSPGPNSSQPAWFIEVGGSLYFRANGGLHKTDGTSPGTQLIAPVGTQASTVLNGRLYFINSDGSRGSEFWTTDGTEEGTHIVIDALPGLQSLSPSQLTALGDTILFRGNDLVKGAELWKFIPVDPVGPNVTDFAFDYETGHRVRVTFSKPIATPVNATSLQIRKLTTSNVIYPAQVQYDPTTRTATFTFSPLLNDGSYRVTLVAGAVEDTDGNELESDFSFDFFVKAGDANRDRKVDLLDYLRTDRGLARGRTGFSNGDFNYDEVIDGADYFILDQAYLGSLPLQSPPAEPETGPGASAFAAASAPADDDPEQESDTPPVWEAPVPGLLA